MKSRSPGPPPYPYAAARLRRARRFLLNDIHAPLIALWRRIVLDPNDTSAKYREIWRGQLGKERAYYDAVRTRFNKQHRPEDFLCLLARCVRAAIRYNSSGELTTVRTIVAREHIPTRWNATL